MSFSVVLLSRKRNRKRRKRRRRRRKRRRKRRRRMDRRRSLRTFAIRSIPTPCSAANLLPEAVWRIDDVDIVHERLRRR
jgi:hypothetical protein